MDEAACVLTAARYEEHLISCFKVSEQEEYKKFLLHSLHVLLDTLVYILFALLIGKKVM